MTTPEKLTMIRALHSTPGLIMATIKEFLSLEEMHVIYPLIKQLNPDMDHACFLERLSAMHAGGYRCIGAFDQADCIGVSGFWINHRLYCGKYIEVDNLVVDQNYRTGGIGRQLLEWIKDEGKRLDCRVNVLSTYATSKAAHRFYFREGFHILGFHFSKTLMD